MVFLFKWTLVRRNIFGLYPDGKLCSKCVVIINIVH